MDTGLLLEDHRTSSSLMPTRAAGHMASLWALWIVVSVVFYASLALALEPQEIVVVANARVKESIQLAEEYMQLRNIPPAQLLKIQVTPEEHCSRQDYTNRIYNPVRRFLHAQSAQIRCLVVMYGVPLAIRRAEGEAGNATHPERTETRAAVDSELALVLATAYPLHGWLPNPYFLGSRGQATLLKRDEVLMVSRLDGPDPDTVRRVLADTLWAEKHGLQGRACFDARWPKPGAGQHLSGYALYDAAIHQAAEHVQASGRMPVRVDSTSALFQPGDCPETALYCGWYSLARYVDAFSWTRGAVGYHIASAECATLRKADSQVWCKRMLEQGVAAVIGPVYEPYVEGFPRPDIFFAALTKGSLSLAESYLVSLPYLSWHMVLIGDPLYRPFSGP